MIWGDFQAWQASLVAAAISEEQRLQDEQEATPMWCG